MINIVDSEWSIAFWRQHVGGIRFDEDSICQQLSKNFDDFLFSRVKKMAGERKIRTKVRKLPSGFNRSSK